MEKQIIFLSAEIDAEYLNMLYDGDTDILMQVFEASLAMLPEITAALEASFAQQDVQQLKQTVHKYKSSLGYAGFTDIAKSMQLIENQCTGGDEVSEIQPGFEALMASIKAAGPVLEAELAHLKQPV